MPTHILGLTRFSLVTKRTLTGFRATRDLTFEAAQALIYEPVRMEGRFKIFEATCLPTYRMMHKIHAGSVGLILVAESMPQHYRDRLDTLTRDGSIRVLTVPDHQRASPTVDRFVRTLPPDDRVYTYRYDDDDILASHFIPTILGLAATVPDGTVVSFDAGYSLKRRPSGYALSYQLYPLIAIGLGLFCRPGAPDTALALGNHVRVEEKRKVYHVVDRESWIRLSHDQNDSGATHEDNLSMPALSYADLLRQTFPDFPQLERCHFEAMPYFRKPVAEMA